LHSGAAASRENVIGNITHRTAGRAGGVDVLTSPVLRQFLVQFLKSIDRDTRPFLNVVPPADVCGP
jgi:hypothetical protein